jgi:hypothetical protein
MTEGAVDLGQYKGIRFEFEEAPAKGLFHIKIYGDEDGREQYTGFEGTSAYVAFDPQIIGSQARRTTLQYLKEGGTTITLKRTALVRNDGTEEECMPSVFWGCEIELVVAD